MTDQECDILAPGTKPRLDYTLIGAFVVMAACALSWSMFDPSDTGMLGAYIARPLLVIFGLCAWTIPVVLALLGIRFIATGVLRG